MEQLDTLQKMYEENNLEKKNVQIESLKLILRDKAVQLKTLKSSLAQAELQASNIQKEITDVESSIRKEWAPFLNGVTEAELDLGDTKLQMKTVLNIKKEDDDLVTQWLLENGYKDVLKYQIHHQTLKSIATELYNKKEGSDLIPGITYTNFPLIKVK